MFKAVDYPVYNQEADTNPDVSNMNLPHPLEAKFLMDFVEVGLVKAFDTNCQITTLTKRQSVNSTLKHDSENKVREENLCWERIFTIRDPLRKGMEAVVHCTYELINGESQFYLHYLDSSYGTDTKIPLSHLITLYQQSNPEQSQRDLASNSDKTNRLLNLNNPAIIPDNQQQIYEQKLTQRTLDSGKEETSDHNDVFSSAEVHSSPHPVDITESVINRYCNVAAANVRFSDIKAPSAIKSIEEYPVINNNADYQFRFRWLGDIIHTTLENLAGVAVVQHNSDCIVNKLRFAKQESTNQHWEDILSVRHRATRQTLDIKLCFQPNSLYGLYQNDEGTYREQGPVFVISTPLPGNTGQIRHLILTFHDFKKIDLAEQQLKEIFPNLHLEYVDQLKAELSNITEHRSKPGDPPPLHEDMHFVISALSLNSAADVNNIPLTTLQDKLAELNRLTKEMLSVEEKLEDYFNTLLIKHFPGIKYSINAEDPIDSPEHIQFIEKVLSSYPAYSCSLSVRDKLMDLLEGREDQHNRTYTFLFVRNPENSLIGYAACTTIDPEFEQNFSNCTRDEVLEIKHLYVLPEYRGQNVSTLLLQGLIKNAHQKGVRFMTANISTHFNHDTFLHYEAYRCIHDNFHSNRKFGMPRHYSIHQL